MRKTYSLLIVMLIFLFLGCENEGSDLNRLPGEEDNGKIEGRVLTLTASIPGDVVYGPEAVAGIKPRLVLSRDELDINLAWKAGDHIELVVAGTDDIQNPEVSIVPGNNKRATFDVLLPESPTYPLTIYGVYGGGGIDPDNPTQALLPNANNSFSKTLDELADNLMLWFKAEVPSEGAPISVTFEHVGALFSIELRNGNGTPWDGVQNIQLTAASTIGAYTSGTLDLATGAVNGTSVGNSITFPLASVVNIPANGAQHFWGWMVPTDDTNWPALTFKVNGATVMSTFPPRTAPKAGSVYYMNAGYPVSSYTLSGTTLSKWLGPEEHINMNIDSKLREVQTIAWGAFANNASMISLIVGDKVKEMKDYAFAGNTKLTTVKLPDGIQTLGQYCFNASPLLASINLPGTLTTIKNGALAGTKLTSVEIPNSVTSFGNGVFNGCTELTSAILPNSMEAISNSTFFKCTKLVNVELGNNVTSIGIYAFANCTALRKIDLPTASPPTVDPETFTSTPLSLVTLEVPVGSKSLYQAATIWSSFATINEK